jgi:hypothetical protein
LGHCAGTGNLCSGGSRAEHAGKARLCRLAFKSGAADAEPHRTPLVGEVGSKTPAASTSQTGTVMLSYCQFAKFQKRRQEAAGPILGILPNFILSAAGLPNKRILASATVHF